MSVTSPSTKETVTLEEQIQARNDLFVQYFNAQDAAGIASLYAPDAAVFPPNAEMISGRDGIQAMWQGVFGMGVTGATLTTREALQAGPFANEHGVYAMFVGEAKIDWGKFIVIWKKIGPDWFLFRDMWNSSQPAG